MKINKSNPTHWLQLVAYASQATLGFLLRPLSKKSAVVLYGHKLNGNLLPLYRACTDAVFLSMDRQYCRTLKAQGIRAQWACSIGAAALLARSRAIISDHGLHSLEVLLPSYQRAGLKCFDVWHGIPFKGFDTEDFRLQHTYDEVWVASPLHKKLYVERYGFPAEKVVITGYARTDVLVTAPASNAKLRRQLGLPADGPVILFAPTWAQDTRGRSLYPFSHSEQEFLSTLSTFAQEHRATVVIRTHLNSGNEQINEYPNIVRMPSSQWPDTESILQVSDILVCDWSSIAFDYLLLDRPTLFLDVPAPFRKGFSLGPEYRFGALICSLKTLIQELERAIEQPDEYWCSHAEKHRAVRSEIYSDWADGDATRRYLERLDSSTSV
ncbi:CDP-glycerol glycerophosphotransferase family protein [Halopseudomonas aestusnigri]|uniref:CDP-glycerol glycerophosphotransferase family protein n=1 Tax=Halopseudomonas aestusnigri TaxID=857252 RepID=UPI0025558834|nr:CDP-glycerol glycerophosphotransferase family protein [Halopseudomonas aestusnigri]MDL2198439.1 CDP-glycerol glycerophosphotransferase family protein [Halopseudomonas aestusnigri]